MSDPFAAAQRIADAVLYEGYLLYPYHASSSKNRVRFQFGVVVPRAHSELDPSETWQQQTELLVAPTGGVEPRLTVRVRFLQLQARSVEAVDLAGPNAFHAVPVLTVGPDELVAWDEAIEGAVDIADVSLAELLGARAAGRSGPVAIAAGTDSEPGSDPDGTPTGRIVRTRWPIEGRVILVASPVDSFVRLTVRIENLSESADTAAPVASRDDALRRSLLGCHTLLAVQDGAFISQTDPPATAAAAAAACRNVKLWPVLVGDEGSRDLVLSSPIILSDHPAVAPESPRDLFDGAEIDEILTLRIMTLSDEEKRQARATDPRARAIIDATDDMPPEIFDRLHGSIRYLRGGPAGREIAPTSGPSGTADDLEVAIPYGPFDRDRALDFPTLTTPTIEGPLPSSVWEPQARIAPELMTATVGDRQIAKGSSVRLLPVRRADAMDTFLIGRLATVEAIFESVDDEMFVAVTIDDDPGNDLHRASGRYFYFSPDELEVVDRTAVAAAVR
ncbi:MAG: hypothetical protein NVS9B8_02000 [Candidatus Limnocylindrales bacterium]